MNASKSIPAFIPRLAWGLCLVLGVALSFKSLREPDLWWMYRTGEWMLENGQVTYTDPFSYTFTGTDWINVKWLFEVFIAWGKGWFGTSFIMLWQAVVTTLMVVLVGRSAQWVRRATLTPEAPTVPFAGAVLATLMVLVTIDFRLIGRPEMSSHLLTTAYLYLFWRYYYEPSKVILWLIPLQLLWTNLHEAFGIGLVLMVGYTVATWVQYALAPRMGWKRPPLRWLNMGVLGAILAVGINPRGAQMWLHPFNIFGQLSDNQFTTELASIWKADYWNWQAYANLLFLGISLAFVIGLPFWLRRQQAVPPPPPSKKGKKKTTKKTAAPKQAPLLWLQTSINRFGMGNGALVLMLLYLSTTAYRNIPFFMLAAAPLVAVGLEAGLQRLNRPWLAWVLALGLGLGLYGSLVLGVYHKTINTRDQYGLQVLSSHNPIGAAQFIEQQGIKGRCFSDYLTSAYLLWHLQPDFKTYIDLRDLDIFPSAFFMDFAEMTAAPELFDQQADSIGIDYVVLFRPQYANLHQYLIESPKYELVFADPVACVYVKNLPRFQTTIQQHGYQARNYADVFAPLPVVPSSGLAYGLSKLIHPLYQPTDYSDVDQDAIAGSFYFAINNNERAFERGQASIQSGAEPWKGYELLGNMYNTAAFAPQTADSLRQNYITLALTQYDNAIRAKPDYLDAYLHKAVVYLQQEDFLPATALLQQILDQDPNFAPALQYMMMVYKVRATQNGNDRDYARQWLDYALQLDRLNPNNPFIRLDIGLAYCTLGSCTQALDYLNAEFLTTPGLPAEELKTAQRCLKQCGG